MSRPRARPWLIAAPVLSRGGSGCPAPGALFARHLAMNGSSCHLSAVLVHPDASHRAKTASWRSVVCTVSVKPGELAGVTTLRGRYLPWWMPRRRPTEAGRARSCVLKPNLPYLSRSTPPERLLSTTCRRRLRAHNYELARKCKAQPTLPVDRDRQDTLSDRAEGHRRTAWSTVCQPDAETSTSLRHIR
jgi:hypothetical protein